MRIYIFQTNFGFFTVSVISKIIERHYELYSHDVIKNILATKCVI
jgi:hypothetical protein